MIYSIIFDWKRTLYDPDTQQLIAGAYDLLEYLQSAGIKLILIGKGAEEMHDAVERLKVKKYFSKVVFQEGKKDSKQFEPFISPTNSKDTIFIGDRVRSELAIGNALRTTTIWVKQGKFATEEPENESQKPTYTVSSLHECLAILKNLVCINYQ